MLKEQGLPITRITFYKLENAGLFQSKRNTAGWRIYTAQDAELIIKLIKENYGHLQTEELEQIIGSYQRKGKKEDYD